ncbi:gamma-glutamyltransferase family protein [Yoonia vestfoldensis]|uniref:gamma-glutamyltransferase family protein n=1 Tax=Yoonia vestfoldensis TaxID=245188 RepID=UPI00036A444A|nr:gamma-glutamyltransferase [Yoonia vestfoldensis]
MISSAYGFNGGFSAPHRAAALAGRDILAAGGSAVEAMVAAAATIAVAYPHMNGIGGDGFWIIHRPGQPPVAVAGCGRAAGLASVDWYAEHGIADAVPARGPLAALTVPGTIAGWRAALQLCPKDNRLPLADLLAPAIALARDGVAVTENQARTTREKLDGLRDVPGFAQAFLHQGQAPKAGHRLVQSALGRTLAQLATAGLDDYYRGDLARTHAGFLQAAGSPLRVDDFSRFDAEVAPPLTTRISAGRLFNSNPPTQGISSLMILALFDRLGVTQPEGFAHLHGLIEATKLAFLQRNAELGDPDYMAGSAQDWLDPDKLDVLVEQIDTERARPWPEVAKPGDTIWMGAADKDGCVVSFIQSVFWEFGSGLVCPDTGVFFQNRGAGFSLAAGPNQLRPFARPFHTLNPALAHLDDGRVLAYGTMGGEGQPQTQAALFSRYALFGQDLQQAITAPRWLLGKTWGDATTSLKLESRFDPALIACLRAAGHHVEMIPDFSDLAGHAGGVALWPDGVIEVGADPRSDGAALGF